MSDPVIGEDAGDDATAAKIVSDIDGERTPGGGGLGGASASNPLDQSGRGSGGASPNSPIDVQAPHPEGSAEATGHEAALRAAGDAPEDKIF